MLKRLICIFAIAAISTGCAEFTHLTRTRSLGNDSKAILIDAKQRSIISAKRPILGKGDNNQNATVKQYLAICAEPSPDALSALATTAGASGSKKDALDLSLSFGLSEGAASIGLRTQSIQLMRDAMYRLCEGYLSGSLGPSNFETLFRRLQNSMVAVLAIEQLTGAIRAPAVALNGSAIVGAAELASKYTELTQASRAAVRKSETKVANAETKLKAEKSALDATTQAAQTQKATVTQLETELAAAKEDSKKKELTTKLEEEKKKLAEQEKLVDEQKKKHATAATAVEDAKKELAENNSTLELNDKARNAALAGNGNSGVDVTIETMQANPALSDASVKQVAKAVTAIVDATLKQNYAIEACVTLVLGEETADTNPKFALCKSVIESQINLRNAVKDKIGTTSEPGDTTSVNESIELLRALESTNF